MLKALGIFQRATAEHLWRMLRPGDSHDRITRDTLNALKNDGKVRVETRLESNHQLWVLTERGHKEAKQLLPKNVRVSALRKLEYDDGEPVTGDGFDEHAAAVTMTAAVLTGAEFGTPLSWQTEISHKLPYGYTQYADLTMLAPDAGVPAMLLEVDRVNEPVDVLVAKLRRYTEWFELLAPKADKDHERAARSYKGARVHDFRMWSRIYPATGHEGYVPVAFVFTGKPKAQRESRIRRLEQSGRRYFAGKPYAGSASGITAIDYHRAVPVVVTELERITADPDGAAGKVWRRLGRDENQWQTLGEALDNPDGDHLYAVEREEARRRQEEREAAEREAKRPVCSRCGNKFTDDRWQLLRQSSWRSEQDDLRAVREGDRRPRQSQRRRAPPSRRGSRAGGGRSGGEEKPQPVRPAPVATSARGVASGGPPATS
ncbi:replication-relaxation family protein [Streptomyces sp. NPDC056154]|uniref:replication-relaxation family protein n=1 Tax=unclassified Streptomyces TaxID=2593676 RepID=UPI0035DA5500